MSLSNRGSRGARAPVALCAAAAVGASAAAFLVAPGVSRQPASRLHARGSAAVADADAWRVPLPSSLSSNLVAAASLTWCIGAACAAARARKVGSRRQPLRQVRRFFGGGKEDKEGGQPVAEYGQAGEEELSEQAQANCEKLQEEIAALKTEAEDKSNSQARLKMETNNFRTRTRKELTAARGKAAIPIIKELLPIADEFELATANLKLESDSEKALCARFDKLFEQMIASWKALGVTKLTSVGEAFNPEFHEAISMIPSADYKEELVCNELRGGWVIKPSGSDDAQVLRPALVCVSSGPGPQ